MKKKILYVEDELNLGTIVTETLEQNGYHVLHLKDGNNFKENVLSFQPDICILDVMLPIKDGFTLSKELRENQIDIPIIFLTAKSQTKDVVQGFESGGTEYLRKPFSIDELLIRIRNQFRFASQLNQTAQENIHLSQFIFIPKRYELHYGLEVIKVSNREAEILSFFAQHINQTVDRKSLLLAVWGDDSYFHSRNLDVYIRKLREYFSKDSGIQIITLKAKGYQFIVEKNHSIKSL